MGTFFPAMSAINVETINQEIKENPENTEDTILVKVHYMGNINEKDVEQKMISKEQAFQLLNIFKDKNKLGLNGRELLEKQMSILKDFDLITSNIYIDTFINEINKYREKNEDNPYIDPYFFGFAGFGWSFPIGSHSLPKLIGKHYIFGLDVILPFVGFLFGTTFQDPTDVPPVGLIFAGFAVGYIGIILDLGIFNSLDVSGIFGPLLIGVGVSLFGQPINIPPLKNS
jgi:hypothetical protein